jgi:hypothetical protein
MICWWNFILFKQHASSTFQLRTFTSSTFPGWVWLVVTCLTSLTFYHSIINWTTLCHLATYCFSDPSSSYNALPVSYSCPGIDRSQVYLEGLGWWSGGPLLLPSKSHQPNCKMIGLVDSLVSVLTWYGPPFAWIGYLPSPTSQIIKWLAWWNPWEVFWHRMGTLLSWIGCPQSPISFT